MAQCHKRAFVSHPARATHPRGPPSSGVTAGTGWEENVIDLPPTRPTFSAVYNRSAVEYRKLKNGQGVHRLPMTGEVPFPRRHV